MENKNKKNKNVVSSSSSSSSSSSLDHLFGPRDSSSLSSNTGLFSSIFPPPSTVLARDQKRIRDLGCGKYENSEKGNKKAGDSMYEREECTFSSSIHYGGQENYSPTTTTTHQSPHYNNNIKKDGSDDDSNANNPNSASRGNWWQGSLYY